MKKKLFLFVFLALLLSSINLTAQVTIGSGQTPNKGALLDLNESIDDPLNIGVTGTKGLALPRVSLKSFKKLEMSGNLIAKDSDGTWNSHTGLMVFNIPENYDECDPDMPTQGLHVWTGSRWKGIRTPPPYEPITRPPGPESIYEPNSFMYTNVGTPGTLSIPVAKAFDIWDWWGRDSKAVVGRLFLSETSQSFGNQYVADLVWQEGMGTDDDNIVESVTLDNPALGRNANILVKLTGKVGNAVVAFSDGVKIRWSWHIWVTPDPTTTTYSLNTGEQTNVWMDRNLGATTATPRSAGAAGLYYQWGRKDPFMGIKKFSTVDGETHTLSSITIPSKSVNDAMSPVDGVVPENGLAFVINNPDTYIIGKDWYSNSGEQWGTRWGHVVDECQVISHYKTEIDPCPAGWKIPGYIGPLEGHDLDTDKYSPWAKSVFNLDDMGTPPEDAEEGSEELESWVNENIYKLWTNETWNLGWEFNREDYLIGWYPATGMLGPTGVYEAYDPEKHNSDGGYYWSVSPLEDGVWGTDGYQAAAMAFHKYWPISTWSYTKGVALPIRCVKDDKL